MFTGSGVDLGYVLTRVSCGEVVSAIIPSIRIFPVIIISTAIEGSTSKLSLNITTVETGGGLLKA
jgi:hypothetical protein